MAPARPPKFDPPRLARVVERERVSRLFDESSTRAVVWLAAQGGAGKTTAVATWLSRRKRRAVWMHLDAGDTHVAAFLEYFEGALRAALPRLRLKLPVYSKEAEADVAGFARRYFRALFPAFPHPAPAIVFDDVQELPEASPVHLMLAALCEECPAEVALIFASRSQPPAPYLKLATYGRVEVIGGTMLDFTPEELAGALIARGIAIDARLAEVHAASGGWIAGALLLSMRERVPGTAAGPGAAGADGLFDFFAAEAFASLDGGDRHLLVRTSFLRDVTPAAARALCGDDRAAERLEGLARRNTFTERRGAEDPRYRYHDLFRAFLQRNAAQDLAPAQLHRLRMDTAAQLAGPEDAQESISLLVECRAWDEASHAILRHVEPLLSKGRHLTVAAWLRALPTEALDATPWLRFWLGQCLLYSDEGAAQASLEAAFARFDALDDAAGRLASAVSVPLLIRARHGKVDSVDAWLARIAPDAARVRAFPTPYIELKCLGPLLFYAQIDDAFAPFAELAPQRILALLDQVHDPNLQLESLREIVILGWRMRRHGEVPGAARAVERLGLMDKASPLAVLHWLTDYVIHESCYGSIAAAQALLDRSDRASIESGLAHLPFAALALRLEVALDAADTDEAVRLLPLIEATTDPKRPSTIAAVLGYRGRLALLNGDGRAALAHNGAANAILDELAVPVTSRLSYFMIEAAGRALCDDFPAALESCRRQREGSRGDQVVLCDVFAHCVRALAALRSGAPEAAALLAHALAFARESRYILFFRHANVLAQEFCAEALKRGIETAFVREAIARRRLPPPDADIADWPWPLKVRALGRFEIERDGEPVAHLGKQQKTLQLLQMVVALGGRDVAVERVIDALWPGVGRVGQQQAFDTTLHRLRKLLGSESALRVAERRVSVNDREVWVDAMSLVRRLDEIEAAGPMVPGARELAKVAEVVSLYRGHFLAAAGDEPWALAARERLWDRVRRLLLAFAGAAGRAGESEQALRIHHFIADLDPLAEDAFLELMRHFARMGQKAEALRAYQRCAAALATELGSTPAAALQALALELRGQP